MFDSVICARDRWLKPTGVMYPSHARMWMAPIRTGIVEQKLGDYQSAMGDWHNFVDETKAFYGVDMSTLAKPFAEEQRKYYLQATPDHVLACRDRIDMFYRVEQSKSSHGNHFGLIAG
ncbi:protein arginine N-methyltransferase PRMT10-like [Trifolium pratense]|uniref:Protein arginine N-methyltransferase PRMT10-like n=1 Tax=Trifolium pratense TaxID=57577 RepID=A0A2K3PJH2_TRIPR|nr:protein arginine N-methyltransferase PRMT10-like [Trifolium pratense]